MNRRPRNRWPAARIVLVSSCLLLAGYAGYERLLEAQLDGAEAQLAQRALPELAPAEAYLRWKSLPEQRKRELREKLGR